MKQKFILLAFGMLLVGVACSKEDKPKDEESNHNDTSTESLGKMNKIISDQCAKYDNDQEATICASDGKETWSVYCFDGEAFPDYSENCTAQGMGCDNLEFTNGTFGICTCTSAAQCSTEIEHADPVCTERGECRFRCKEGYHETTVRIEYEEEGIFDIIYKCAEDYETPTDVGSFCTDKEDGYYCLTSSTGDIWQIYCDKAVMDQGYSQNCTSYQEICGLVERDGKTYNLCITPSECENDADCTTQVENADPYCNKETTGGNICSYKCKGGYEDDFLSESCVLIGE